MVYSTNFYLHISQSDVKGGKVGGRERGLLYRAPLHTQRNIIFISFHIMATTTSKQALMQVWNSFGLVCDVCASPRMGVISPTIFSAAL